MQDTATSVDGGASPAREPPPNLSAGSASLLDVFAVGRSRGVQDPERIAALVREHLVRALHVQALRPGDRLPSVRDAAAALGVTQHSALKVYARLQADGLVESRACSGTYVATLDRAVDQPMGETAEWLLEVLEQACAHRIRIPLLPDLVRRWTSGSPLRCACIAETADDEHALVCEVEQQFGLSATAVRLDGLVGETDRPGVPDAAAEADAWVTTTPSAPRVQALAEALGKPLVVAAMNPDHVHAIRRWIADRQLTVVCVDSGFGEQVRRLFAEDRPERVRVIRADDRQRLRSIDPSESILLTRAARDQMGSVSFRLLVAPTSSFCPEFARSMVALLVGFNLRARRGAALSMPAAPARG